MSKRDTYKRRCIVLETKRLVNEAINEHGDLERMAKLTGLDRRWLYRLRKGQIPNPGAIRIQTLYEHLTDTKLVA